MPGPHQVDRAWEPLDLPVMAAPVTAETVLVAPAVLPAAVAMVVVMLMHCSYVRKGRLRSGDEQHPANKSEEKARLIIPILSLSFLDLSFMKYSLTASREPLLLCELASIEVTMTSIHEFHINCYGYCR